MPPVEFLIVLLAAIAGLARLAGVVGVPYPVFLVLGGLGIGLIPGTPSIELDPELVLLIFLPPLLYHAAFFTSPRELRRHAGDIGLLAIGLSFATVVVVAVVARETTGLSWPEAFALGAILGPTDPVAVVTILRRLGAPDRLTTILEGESLVNDGIALVAFRVAAGAIGAGTFSAIGAAGEFVGAAVGGVAIGLVAGWLVKQVRRHLDDPPIEITLSLFTPYLAYLPAERLHVSGVLAAVASGLFLAYQVPTGLFHASTRLQAIAFWDVLVFILNSLLFVLVGLQVRPMMEALGDHSVGFLAGAAAAVIAAVVLTRMLWMFVAGGVAKSAGERIVLGWAGPRGAVSLAAALAVPADAPGRELILFLTFSVIIATLVGQGLTLPRVICRFAPEDTGQDHRGEELARQRATEAALQRLEELERRGDLPAEAIDHARERYELRLHTALQATREVQRELAQAERAEIEGLHEEGEIDQATARRLERELDLQEERWEELEASPLS